MFKINYRKCVFLLIIILLIPIIISLFFIEKKDKRNTSTRTIIIVQDDFSVEMDMEEFIPHVLMAQMPVDSPKALLKAQAVIIRTYILKCMGDEKEISTEKLGLPYILPEQLEEIWFEQYKAKNANTFMGVMANITQIGSSNVYEHNLSKLHNILSDTKSYVMVQNNELILPLFHESSNGKTRSGQENFGESFGYLKRVNCYGSGEIEKNKRNLVFSIEEIKEKFQAKGIIPYSGKTEVFLQEEITAEKFLELVDVSNRDSAGYVSYVKIGDTVISGSDFSNVLGLDSPCFELFIEGNDIRFETVGSGHGFGMSLEYAKQLATEKRGWKEILNTFYDAEICIY